MVVVVLFSQKKGKKCCWLFWLRVYERIYYVKIFAYITSENFFCIYRLPTFYLLPKHIFVRYFFNHVNPIWIIQFKNKSLGIFYSFCALEHIKKINILWYIFKYHSTFISRTKIDFSFLHFQSISMKGLSWTFIKIPVKYAFLGSFHDFYRKEVITFQNRLYCWNTLVSYRTNFSCRMYFPIPNPRASVSLRYREV